MKYLIAFCAVALLSLTVFSQPFADVTLSQPTVAAGAQPLSQFYDGTDSGGIDGGYPGNNALYLAQDIEAGESGNCTRLRMYCSSYTGAATIKLALYNSSLALLGSGSVAPSGTGFWYVTLGAPVAVTSGQTYWVAIESSSNGVQLGTLSGQPNGTSRYKLLAYASFPEDPLALTDDFNRALCIGFGGDTP